VRPAEATISTEKERLLLRIDDIRSMLRDAKSLDVIETLVLALADCEQRVAWIDGEHAITSDPASTPPSRRDESISPATPPDLTLGT
jgi:hypothetical protein